MTDHDSISPYDEPPVRRPHLDDREHGVLDAALETTARNDPAVRAALRSPTWN